MSDRRNARVAEWLARADPDPEHAHRWWAAQRVALLPVGRCWDAVKTPTDIGEQAIDAGVRGPIVSDGVLLYFLVPAGTSTQWPRTETVECLGDTCYLAVPSPDRTAGPGVHWRSAPDGHTLVSPDALAAAVALPVGDAS